MFAAIGSDGVKLVVWGIGDDDAQACQDAIGYLSEPDDGLCLITCEIDEEQRERILAGEVDCRTLGFDTRRLARDLDVHGRIFHAFESRTT